MHFKCQDYSLHVIVALFNGSSVNKCDHKICKEVQDLTKREPTRTAVNPSTIHHIHYLVRVHDNQNQRTSDELDNFYTLS